MGYLYSEILSDIKTYNVTEKMPIIFYNSDLIFVNIYITYVHRKIFGRMFTNLGGRI